MRESAYRKQLLLTRIKLNRRVLDLELESLRGRLTAIRSVVSLTKAATGVLRSSGSATEGHSGDAIESDSSSNVQTISSIALAVFKLILSRGRRSL